MKYISTATTLPLILLPFSSVAEESTSSLRALNAIVENAAAALVGAPIPLEAADTTEEFEPFDVNNVGVVAPSVEGAAKCSSYMDLFPSESYTCISTDLEFESQLLNETVTEMLLCDNFVYNQKYSLDLSNQEKTVVCSSGCEINGNLFYAEEEQGGGSAFTATESAQLTFCGVDFVDFFNAQARVFHLSGADIHTIFEDVRFENNGFWSRGTANSGVMRLIHGTASFANSAFVGNQAPRGGVLQASDKSIVTARNCEFHENVATLGGVFVGGMGVTTSITNSIFNNNLAAFGGVIVYLGSGNSQFTNSEMNGNKAMMSGGVAYMTPSIAAVTTQWLSNRIVGNTATKFGGVIAASQGSKTTIASSELISNKAGEKGGAIYADNGAYITVTLSSFNGNEGGAGPELIEDDSSNSTSIIPSTDGDHIFLASPNARLVSCSTGGNTFENPAADVGVMLMEGGDACV